MLLLRKRPEFTSAVFLERSDPLLLHRSSSARKIRIDLCVLRLVQARVAKHVFGEKICASQPAPAPIDEKDRVRLDISVATRAGTTSISAAKAPAASRALTSR